MTVPRRTPLADILSRHNLRTAAGLARCIDEAVAAYDNEVLDEPIDAQTGQEMSPESPTGSLFTGHELLSEKFRKSISVLGAALRQ